MNIAHDTLRRWLLTSGDARKQAVLATGPIAYWPLSEGSGATITDLSGNGYNGAYSGVTWDGTSSPYGKPVPFWDGANDYGNVYSAGLGAAFDLDEFTIMLFVKVANAGVWTDSTVREPLRFFRDGTNYVQITRLNTDNDMRYRRVGNSGLSNITVGGYSTTDWFSLAITASIAGGGLLNAGEFGTWQDGIEIGTRATNAIASAGSGLGSTQTLIGASQLTPVQVWNGYFAEAAVWNRPIDTDILALM